MEKLEEEGQEYLLLTPERRRNEVIVDVNYSLINEDSLIATIAVLEKLAEKLFFVKINNIDWFGTVLLKVVLLQN